MYRGTIHFSQAELQALHSHTPFQEYITQDESTQNKFSLEMDNTDGYTLFFNADEIETVLDSLGKPDPQAPPNLLTAIKKLQDFLRR